MSCEYCKNKNRNECIIDSVDITEGILVRICRDGNGAYLVADGWYDGFIAIDPRRAPIRFCPMCGEELR